MWLLLEHLIEEAHFDLLANALRLKRLNIKVGVGVEDFEVLFKCLLAVGVVELGIVGAPIGRVHDTLLLVPVFTEGKLLVQPQVSLKELDLITHLDLVAVVDQGHLLAVLLRHFLIEQLLRILLLFALLSLVLVQVGCARVQVYVRELV